MNESQCRLHPKQDRVREEEFPLEFISRGGGRDYLELVGNAAREDVYQPVALARTGRGRLKIRASSEGEKNCIYILYPSVTLVDRKRKLAVTAHSPTSRYPRYIFKRVVVAVGRDGCVPGRLTLCSITFTSCIGQATPLHDAAVWDRGI
jgi:hypothetical protein